MNSGADQQIKAAYEVNKMTPEQIADDLGFRTESVKAKLMQCSSIYRKACGLEPESESRLNLSEDEQFNIKQRLYDTFMASEDEHVIVKLGTYLRDDGKGRKDIVRQMAGTSFNILQFNQMLQLGRQGAERIKQLVNGNQTVKDGNLLEA